MANPGNPDTHNSLWSPEPGGFEGSVAFNDNHVEFSNTSVLTRTTHDGTFWANDNIFVAEGGANNNTRMISRGLRDVSQQ